MNHDQSRINDMAQDWMEQVDHMGPFAPLDKLQRVYDQAPDIIFNTPEYWYVSGLIQGRQGYQPLPDANITAEQHLDVLEMIAENPQEYGMEMAQQAAGLRDGYSIALGYYGDPRQ